MATHIKHGFHAENELLASLIAQEDVKLEQKLSSIIDYEDAKPSSSSRKHCPSVQVIDADSERRIDKVECALEI